MKNRAQSAAARLPRGEAAMPFSWSRVPLIGLTIGALMLVGSQIGGQSPEQQQKSEISQKETTVPQQTPTTEEKAPNEQPAASPPSTEPKAEKADSGQTPEAKPNVEEAPVEKPAEKPTQTQQPVIKRPPPPIPRPAPRPARLLFGTKTTAHVDLTPFPQWTGSLERYYRRRSEVPGPCEATVFNGCHLQRWKAMLREVAGETRERQLNLVNRYMNTHRYIVDPINWGVNEYWAIPHEFLKKFGDCEDYAIAKYLSLLGLGWSADDMRIVVLQDLNLRVMHAVLIVNFEGKNMLLDNQITRVIDASKVHHYRPVYSLNEKGWWRHTPARRTAG